MYFSASYYPLALSLRKSFQYIPCSVVSTLLKHISKSEGLPLLHRPWPALRTPPFAGDFSLTFIGRPCPGAGQPSALCPSKILLSEINKTKPNPPTRKKKNNNNNKRKEKRKKRNRKQAKVLDHCVSVRPQHLQDSRSALQVLP